MGGSKMIAPVEMLERKYIFVSLGYSCSFKEYFKALVSQVWKDGEGFSGKRPWGNSGWQHDVYEILASEGVVPGRMDEEGKYIECTDVRAADRYILEMIQAM